MTSLLYDRAMPPTPMNMGMWAYLAMSTRSCGKSSRILARDDRSHYHEYELNGGNHAIRGSERPNLTQMPFEMFLRNCGSLVPNHAAQSYHLFGPILILFRGRYTQDIAFVGRHVMGNVQTLTVHTSSCSIFEVVGGGAASVAVKSLNEGKALGTATAAQRVKVCNTSCRSPSAPQHIYIFQLKHINDTLPLCMGRTPQVTLRFAAYRLCRSIHESSKT